MRELLFVSIIDVIIGFQFLHVYRPSSYLDLLITLIMVTFSVLDFPYYANPIILIQVEKVCVYETISLYLTKWQNCVLRSLLRTALNRLLCDRTIDGTRSIARIHPGFKLSTVRQSGVAVLTFVSLTVS